MIYTLTTNPAIDYNISTDGIYPKVVNRTFDAVYTPNGKGLNVSFVLNHFHHPSKILGFFGGFSGEYIVNETKKRGYQVLPVWVDDITRINIFLNDGTQEYKFVNAGSMVHEKQKQEMLKMIAQADDMEYLIISGSLPKGVNPDYYDDIMKICQEKDVRVILDISSNKLSELLSYHPYLIKPNDEEVELIFGLKMENENDMIKAIDIMHQKGAKNILLTLGEKGAYFSDGKQIIYASAQKIKLLSSACAGDSALAAFLSIWLDDQTQIEKALKRSAATGANVAESAGLGDLNKVEEYVKNIITRKVR